VNTVTFSNGVTVVNVTPHPLSFLDNDELVTVPTSGVLVNAKIVNQERTEGTVTYCIPEFVSDSESEGKLSELEETLPAGTLVVGSIIAAQAYPGRVVGMTPAPGFERVPPAEKRMSTSRFTRYEK
jgi:hypothetical protein